MKEITAQFLIKQYSPRSFRWDYIDDLQVPTLLVRMGYGKNAVQLPVKSLSMLKHAP